MPEKQICHLGGTPCAMQSKSRAEMLAAYAAFHNYSIGKRSCLHSNSAFDATLAARPTQHLSRLARTQTASPQGRDRNHPVMPMPFKRTTPTDNAEEETSRTIDAPRLPFSQSIGLS